MRKFTLIILLLCGLLVVADGNRVAATTMQQPVASIDSSMERVWQCERTYNSDFVLSRVATVEAPLSVVVVGSQQVTSLVKHLYRGCSLERHRGVATHFVFNYIALSRVVDYYVYRLRRLII